MLKRLFLALVLLWSFAVQAAVYSLPWGPKPQFIDANGAPMSSGTLQTFAAGSSTPQITYTDSTGGTGNPTTITLNTRGESPNEVWLTGGLLYKFVLKDSSGVTVWTVDNVSGVNDTTISNAPSEWIAGPAPTYVNATTLTLAGDQTTTFIASRRLKFTVSAGTVYGTIATSVFGAVTTVTMTMDAAQVLDSGLSAVNYGMLAPTNISIPNFITAGTGVTVTYASGKPTLSVAATGTARTLNNLGLAVTMAGNAVTIALKQADAATDPTSGGPVTIGFRSATLTSGLINNRTVTAALSVAISSGSTGGTISGTASRIWIAAIDNAGAVELAWYNSLSGTSIAPINESGLISTTAEGGVGGADNAQTWYTTSARSNVPVTVLGYFDSTQATAGAWATGAGFIVVNPAFRPGAVLQVQRTQTGAVATGATVMPLDDTIPQITEGDQYMTQAITPLAAANILEIESQSVLGGGGANIFISTALFQDATANALAAVVKESVNNNSITGANRILFSVVAGTTSSTTFRIRSGSSAGATVTFNGGNGARLFGGVMDSYLSVKELAIAYRPREVQRQHDLTHRAGIRSRCRGLAVRGAYVRHRLRGTCTVAM